MIQLENDGVRWEVQPAFAGILESVLSSTAEPVKASPVKAVSRHRFDGGIYYIKRYRHGAVPLRAFKYLFRSSQARQEWILAQALEARAVPIVRHLALGERKTWRGVHESILITEGFDGIPLEEAPGTDPAAVLQFVRRMHEAGVLQRDLHPGNLLVRGQPLEIRLVDLHGITLRTALTPAERAMNLARLGVSFALPVDPPIRQAAAAMRRRLLHDRSWRSLRHNRDFARQRAGGLRWWTRSSALTDAARRVLEDPNGFLASRAQILKPGRSSTVGRADGLVLKRYNPRKVGNLVKDLFRPSKARRSYRKAYHLEMARVPTARAIATADRRCCGLPVGGYVLMEEIPGAVQLGRHLAGSGPPEPALIRQAAELIGRLHREGLSHRDLKESNLVLDPSGRLYLLDLDGLEFVDVISPGRARADLERLARGVDRSGVVERPHRVAFLRHYCRARGVPGPKALGW